MRRGGTRRRAGSSRGTARASSPSFNRWVVRGPRGSGSIWPTRLPSPGSRSGRGSSPTFSSSCAPPSSSSGARPSPCIRGCCSYSATTCCTNTARSRGRTASPSCASWRPRRSTRIVSRGRSPIPSRSCSWPTPTCTASSSPRCWPGRTFSRRWRQGNSAVQGPSGSLSSSWRWD